MEHDRNDEEIIALYKDGNQEIFKQLIDKYASPLYNFTARIAGRENAPDIAQETFIKAWKKIAGFNPAKASFKTWIFTIAKNTATDYLRKKKSVLFSDLEKNPELEGNFSENIPDEKLLPDEILNKLQEKEILEGTLRKLNPNYQEILLLHYQQEMTFDEIGKILNKPLNTVKSQHRRAIIKLREILQ